MEWAGEDLDLDWYGETVHLCPLNIPPWSSYIFSCKRSFNLTCNMGDWVLRKHRTWHIMWGGDLADRMNIIQSEFNLYRSMQVQWLHPRGQGRQPQRKMFDRISPLWKMVSPLCNVKMLESANEVTFLDVLAPTPVSQLVSESVSHW